MFFTFSILAYFAILLSILFNPCYLIPVLVAFFFFFAPQYVFGTA